jgi:hypothetical protein
LAPKFCTKIQAQNVDEIDGCLALISRISFQIENGADLCALNSAGKSAFYTAIKHAPNSFRSIEKRLDKGLILENPGSDSGPIIKMDFFAIVPRYFN